MMLYNIIQKEYTSWYFHHENDELNHPNLMKNRTMEYMAYVWIRKIFISLDFTASEE